MRGTVSKYQMGYVAYISTTVTHCAKVSWQSYFPTSLTEQWSDVHICLLQPSGQAFALLKGR